jgi:hypothetical protein
LIIDDATTSKRERGSRFGKRPCAGAEIMLMFRHAVEGLVERPKPKQRRFIPIKRLQLYLAPTTIAIT